MKNAIRLLTCLGIFVGSNLGASNLEAAEMCDNHVLGRERCEAALIVLRERVKSDVNQKQTLTGKNATTNVSAVHVLVPRQNPVRKNRIGNVALTRQNPDNPVLAVEAPTQETTIQYPVWHPKIPYPTRRPAYAYLAQRPSVDGRAVKPAVITSTSPTVPVRVATSACLDPGKISEPDIAGQRRILSRNIFCITEEKVSEAGLDWRIFVIKNTKQTGPLFVIPHDNENSAFPAAVHGLLKYGGVLVAIEAGEKRLFQGQDPNRNFGTTRAVAARCPKQRAAAPKFTKAILKHRKGRQPIIALHSNSNGWSGNGGSGTISIRRKSNVMRPFATSVARSNAFKDEDTLIVLASTKLPGKDRKQQAALDYFTKKAGVNVLYEYVKPSHNDCSLSNYVVLNRLGTYFNIEVENNQIRTQKKVLDIVMAYLGR